MRRIESAKVPAVDSTVMFSGAPGRSGIVSVTTIRVEQVRVQGDRATVDATVSHNAGAGNAESILLVKENGDWKVTQVGF